jgi:molybdopterin converting factor small subunit
MRVTVQYMAQLRRLAGCSSEEIDFPGGTLGELLVCVAERHGAEFRGHLLAADATPHKALLFFVGDEAADSTRPLCDGDCVTILSPMAGG